MLTSIFRKKTSSKKQVNILQLQKDDLCYYHNYKEPFKVVETGVTNRGVFYVEIKNIKSGKTHIFTHDYLVWIDDLVAA